MMTLLREALSWNYVLVTAVISSLLAQFTKVILNLIILGKFIPERLWGAGGMPSAHSATVCALLVATGRYCGTGSTEFALALVLAIIVMYDAMGVRRETGEQAKILNRMLPGTDREASPRNSVEDILNFYISLFLYLLITASYTQRTSLRSARRRHQPRRCHRHSQRPRRRGRVPGCARAAAW